MYESFMKLSPCELLLLINSNSTLILLPLQVENSPIKIKNKFFNSTKTAFLNDLQNISINYKKDASVFKLLSSTNLEICFNFLISK